ncbi:MAG: A/G-specific adenine glycosylase [Candidatus Neomarinimicrobiota bacterium]
MYNTDINSVLLGWYDKNKRNLPWRDIHDPYKTWLSEVMLQQTQVNTVIPYYNKWIAKYPTLSSVAETKIDDLLKLWEGLGYYSRCRNFFKASQIIMNEYEGEIPSNITEFESLPGVGPYIASAVMSIAFNNPQPAVDGNINRIMFRYLGLKNQTKYNRTRIYSKLSTFISLKPGDIIQALMDIGSLICKPNLASCDQCPLSISCKGFLNGSPLLYPIYKNKKSLPSKNIIAGLVQHNDKIFITKRKDDGALGGLWELPMILVKDYNDHPLFKTFLKDKYNLSLKINNKIGKIIHSFSHYKMNIQIFNCEIINTKIEKNSNNNSKWISRKEIVNYAFHKANHKLFDLLEKNNV